MRMTRRQLLATGSALAAGLSAPGILRAQGVKEIRVIEAGGKSGESMDAYINPYTKASGVKVVRENPNPFGKLRSLVQAGQNDICLFELGSTGMEQAKALNLIEPLDWAAIAPDEMFPEAKDPMGFGWQYYSTLLAWREGVKAPKNWADFFNTKDFPGKRSMQDRPYGLVYALLADGVPKDKLYPLDLDRAFKAMDRVKKDVSVWWSAGAQPPQLLKDNEVQYAVSYSGRVAGQPGIAYTWEEAVLDLAYMVVPKGAKPADKAAAMKLLHHFSKVENQAEAAKVISYPGPSPKLAGLLPKDKLQEFPTANREKQIINNVKWWFDNAEMVEKRWQAFKLSL